MITPADFICLPFTPDLTAAGISYACRSLPHTYDRMGRSPFDRLRHTVAAVSVELALRRYLTQQAVPFGVRGATPFTDPDQYDVSLGGHRCDIKSFLISHRSQILSLRGDPAQLLKAPGLVPLDQFAGDAHSQDDLYLFAFLTGLIAAMPADLQKASAARQPVHLLHVMPPPWVRPQIWAPLGPLVFKSESQEATTLEIGGQNAAREFITRGVEVPAHTRVEVDDDFHSLAYVHAVSALPARLGIRSTSRRETYLIQPTDWGNIWVYGMRIYLTGWIRREEFRRRATLVQEGSRVFQYDRTRTKNLAVPIADLRPLPELIARAGTWSAAHSNASGAVIV